MKTRTALVSNSSSSSFIVVFPKKPESMEDAKKFLFNGKDGSIQYYDNYSMTHDEIANIVFNDCRGNKIATAKELAEEFRSLVWWDAYQLKQNFEKGKDPIRYMLDNIGRISPKLIEICKDQADLEIRHKLEQKQFCDKHSMHHFWGDAPSKKIEVLRREIQIEQRKSEEPLEEASNKEVDSIAMKMAKEYIADHNGWWFTILGYSDDCKSGSLMEHGGIFSHVEHTQISHH